MYQRSSFDLALKRLVDVVGATVGLLLLVPLTGFIAVAIKLDSEGPVFFRHQRVGQFGRPLSVLKFRTMVRDAPELGPSLTTGGDPRVTRVGSVLRKAKLDELPQFVNVLAGSMSLVGPRPEVPEYVALYSETERAVLSLRPGLTDPASVKFRNEEQVLASVEDPVEHYKTVVLPMKLELNLEYAAGATVLSDIGVILGTIRSVIASPAGPEE